MRPIRIWVGGAAATTVRHHSPAATRLAWSSSSCSSTTYTATCLLRRSISTAATPPSSPSPSLSRTATSQSPAPPSSPSPTSIARLLEFKPEGGQEGEALGGGGGGESARALRGSEVVVDGYVRSIRSMKSVSFVALGDGSSPASLQAVVSADQASGLSVGAAVRLSGSWVPSPGKSQSHELRVAKLDVVGPSDAQTYPIQKKYHTPEYLRTVPHLRLRTPFNAALIRLRSDMIRSLSQFFAGRDFVQTHPPVITSSDCEGAGEVFSVFPATDSDTGSTGGAATAPFFRSPKYLTVSSQLHLEALAQAAGNVWALAPTFRAEKSDTSRHLSEFYMLEAEMSFVDELSSVMNLVEDMLRAVATDLYGTKTVDALFRPHRHSGSQDEQAKELEARWRGLTPASRWPCITYTDAIRLLEADHAAAVASDATVRGGLFERRPVWGAGLQAEHERHIAKVVGGGTTPVFVTHYPRAIKAFYMLPSSAAAPSSGISSPSLPAGASGPAEGDTVDCFDLLVPEFCEIAGGSMREHRLRPLLEAMQLHGLAPPRCLGAQGIRGGSGSGSCSMTREAARPVATDASLDWYVDLRRWGCPPHGGFGIGFDRLICYLSGVSTIRDVVAFPRWHGRCDC